MNKARSAEEEGQPPIRHQGLRQVAKKYQGSVYAPEALYQLRDLLFRKKQYYKAFEDFAGDPRYPNTKRFNDASAGSTRSPRALLDGARNRIWGSSPARRTA
jgi:hypothetical protein